MANNEATPFEDKFNLLPLGDDLQMRIERMEALMGVVLDTIVFGQEARLKTAQRTQIISSKVTEILDGFRDPTKVAEQKAFDQEEQRITAW